MAKDDTYMHVDTTNFPDAEKAISEMAKTIGDLKTELDGYKNNLLFHWVGEGRNQFEKSYRVMVRKIEDQSDYTWTIYEDLLTAHEEFLKQDVQAAKDMQTWGGTK